MNIRKLIIMNLICGFFWALTISSLVLSGQTVDTWTYFQEFMLNYLAWGFGGWISIGLIWMRTMGK